MSPSPATSSPRSWRTRDAIAAVALFSATFAFVLWQNSRVALMWDISYILDSSVRILSGQMPYRDFPFIHAPLTFLMQAAIIRLTGRVFFHHVLYAASAGGIASVLTWRTALHTLHGRLTQAWTASLLLAAPICVVGIYSIFITPFYDCDCALAILVSVFLLQRLSTAAHPTRPALLHAFSAGVAMVVPVFFKQNIGLPYLLIGLLAVVTLLLAALLRRSRIAADQTPAPRTLLALLAGVCIALLSAALLLHLTAGIHNYIYWTMTFAAQRRLPGFSDMLAVYAEPSLYWTLPTLSLALWLLHTRAAKLLWLRFAAYALLAAPFAWTLILLLLDTEADDRAANLLALWPLLLILSAALALSSLRRALTLRSLLPIILLATINGTLLSQQLWGSTYAIWPLLVLLLADLLAYVASVEARAHPAPSFTLALTTVIAATLLLCGGLYAASDERLSYSHIDEGTLQHSMLPALKDMSLRGPYLPAFDQLIRYAAANIPASDTLILLPGEDPFYYVTGRTPRFPVLLFDPTTQPYSPAELASLAVSTDARWLIVKRTLELKQDATPQPVETMQQLRRVFALHQHLDNYDIYTRR